MRAHRVKLHLMPDQPLVVPMPPDVREADVEVIVLITDPPLDSPKSKRTMEDFCDWLETQPATGRTAAEIDADLARERASWD